MVLRFSICYTSKSPRSSQASLHEFTESLFTAGRFSNSFLSLIIIFFFFCQIFSISVNVLLFLSYQKFAFPCAHFLKHLQNLIFSSTSNLCWNITFSKRLFFITLFKVATPITHHIYSVPIFSHSIYHPVTMCGTLTYLAVLFCLVVSSHLNKAA